MRDKTYFNRSMLCVDGEDDVLESFRDVLSAAPKRSVR